MLEPYEKGKAADCYKLSWSSYIIVANTFRMNILNLRKPMFWETFKGMRILITTKKAVTSHAMPGTTHRETQSPAVQAPPDRRVIDQFFAIGSLMTHDRRTTEDSPTTQDRPTLAKAERPDRLADTRRERSEFRSLLMRATRQWDASSDPGGRILYVKLSGSTTNYPSLWPGDVGTSISDSAAREAWEAWEIWREEQQ